MIKANNEYARDRLLAILEVLDVLTDPDMVDRQPATAQKAISQLVVDFKEVAAHYFERGRALSPPDVGPEDGGASDVYAYNLTRVVSQIERHANLLCTLVRALPFPMTGGDAGDLRAPAQLAARIIDTVVRRIPANGGTLLPVIDSAYKFIHFRYADGVGVIGVPANQILRPDWQVSVLWHEIAGYALAQTRADDKLGTWIDDARLATYWYEAEQFFATLQKDDPDIDMYVVRQEWLAQFFEDLFSAQAFGGAMEEILGEILRRYKGPDYEDAADAGHPPGKHRLAVLRAYSRRRDGVPASDDAAARWADAVVDLYLRRIEEGDISHPVTDARELALAEKVTAAFRTTILQRTLVPIDGFVQAIAAALVGQGVAQAVQAMIDEAVRQSQDAPIESQPVSNPTSPPSAGREAFKQEIDGCKTLDDLLKVNFIRIDPALPIGPGDGADGPSQKG